MKSFHKANGWLWTVVGGPVDGYFFRMSHSEGLGPDELPVAQWQLQNVPGGHYRLQAVEGKTAKYDQRLFPKYHYVWVDEPMDLAA